LVSLENEKPLKVYKEIRKELEVYDKKNDLSLDGLAEKEEIIILTKTDIVEDKKLIAKKIKEFEKLGKPIFTLSLFDDESVKSFHDELVKILRKL
jgi:GTPase involved in cell partitioning and DNA repair